MRDIEVLGCDKNLLVPAICYPPLISTLRRSHTLRGIINCHISNGMF